RVHAQRRLHAGEAAQARVAALELLADQAVADVVELRAAVLGRQRGAEQAQAGDLGNQLDREAPLFEALADDRQHLLAGEAGDGVLYRALLVAEQGTDVVKVEGVQGHGTRDPAENPHCIGPVSFFGRAKASRPRRGSASAQTRDVGDVAPTYRRAEATGTDEP